MNTNISTIQTIEAYLKQRFNLPVESINEIAVEMYIANHTQGKIKIRYNKKEDRITTNRWTFTMQWWLRKNYEQCACCGKWYTENLSGDVLSTSIMTVYIPSCGFDKDLHLCSPCTMEYEQTLIQIENTIEAITDGLLTFREAFSPLTHVKA